MVTEPTVFVGLEAEAHRLVSRASGPSKIKIKIAEVLPSGSAVARLAAIRLEQGDSDDALALTPLYLKESTARAFSRRYAGNTRVID
jgi:tRNA A37 threonylcarbamoyladenosine modification protein TsaB